MFADAPHGLKLVKNCLLHAGFVLKVGTIITKGPLQALANLTSS